MGEERCRVVGGEVDGRGGEDDAELVGDRMEGFLRGLQELEQQAALVVGGDEVVTRFRLLHAPPPFPPSLPHSPTAPLLHFP